MTVFSERLALVLIVSACVVVWMDGTLRRRLSVATIVRSESSNPPIVTPRMNPNDLRILAFGASRTWGAKLPDPSTQAYPALLSRDAVNLAIRATGPDYPSLCLYTMMEQHQHEQQQTALGLTGHSNGDSISRQGTNVPTEEQYDVIILEFFLDADEHLVRLAKRVRMRYPQATIIILRMWGPLSFEHVPTKTQQGLRGFLKQHGLTFDSPQMASVLRDRSTADDWKYTSFPMSRRFQEEAAEATGAIIWELDLPTNPIDAITSTAHFFDADMVHLSVRGHAMVAAEINKILVERNVQRNDAVMPWSLQDHCESWYESGATTLFHSDSVVMNEFSPDAHKWALEMRDPVSSIVYIDNPLPHPAQLHVRYLKTTPPPGIYPTTRVTVSSETSKSDTETVLEPTGTNQHTHVHVNRVASLGVVPPGRTTLTFEAIEENKPRPFRITGVVLSALDEMVQQQAAKGNQEEQQWGQQKAEPVTQSEQPKQQAPQEEQAKQQVPQPPSSSSSTTATLSSVSNSHDFLATFTKMQQQQQPKQTQLS